MKKRKKVAFVAIALLTLLICIAAVWLTDYYKAKDLALKAVQGSSEVEVKKTDYIVFNPRNSKSETALIFYPGGKVEEEAYAPFCAAVAEKGYRVIVVPMPLKLAVLGGNKADKVIEENKDIKNWAMGGHSLGGVMAAAYTYENQERIKGLALYASYPQAKHNLSGSEIKVLSLWGSEDSVADISKVKEAVAILPKDAVFYEITGGNHGQFGNYGFQKGDGEASITSEEQQEIAVQYTVELLEKISK